MSGVTELMAFEICGGDHKHPVQECICQVECAVNLYETSKKEECKSHAVYSHRGTTSECDHCGVVAEVKETRNIPVTLQMASNASC
ncbi:hypothetical protein CEXT_734141 [Caerostris extrusa]|uniref:Uncharacterized protein n=1 Tax=Caerostris extrusa TaxID=172846 RepID=A0AAV4TSC9_CAEEX|nr:hypothetical protein CEXT_734141 [Caerostris extrusa]